MRFVITKTTVGDRETFQRRLREYRGFLRSLEHKGLLVAAGTYDDRSGGMLLVEVQDLEQAVAIAREDPLVQAGVDRYEVKGWLPALDDETGSPPEERRGRPIAPVDTGPFQVLPEEEGFSTMDAADHPQHAALMVQCFVPEEIPRDDPVRRNYLRVAQRAGLRKLLLLHENQVAGQIEFAPPRGCGLPITGDQVTVINCIWVVDAFTGLGGGQRLLAACAGEARSQSLATIAYNRNLPWMSRGFFESQGFVRLDEVETGRFHDEQPIVASFLWRPLVDGVEPPQWDRDRVRAGLGFCPAYPWMHGRRLYWGKEFAFHGMLVREGLRRPELLSQFPCLGEQRAERWTFVKLGVPRADLNHAVQLLQAALLAEPAYFAHLYGGDDELIVVYPDQVFHISRDPTTWTEAIRYGVDQGIPEEELVFSPSAFTEETF